MTESNQILERLDTIARYTLLGAKQVLDMDDVCALTSLSKSRVYALCSSNEIPHYKRAKLLYFDKSEIENWMKSNRVATDAESRAEAARYDLQRNAAPVSAKRSKKAKKGGK